VPAGPSWLHEVKYDGYRIIARKAGDDITLFSRSGLDWTVRFPAIAQAMQSLPSDIALIDGEIAFVLPDGKTDFKSLQEHIDTPHPAIRYFVFDLLDLDGRDWRKKTLKQRRARLADLLAEADVSDYLIYADYVEGSGAEFFAQACEAGLEGIVSKRAERPYISGRGKDWLKIKCKKGEEFVIGGYSKSKVKGSHSHRCCSARSTTADSSIQARSAPASTPAISIRCRANSSRSNAPHRRSRRCRARSARTRCGSSRSSWRRSPSPSARATAD
jgi:bifunctional non-homologous end joining protein LigD